MFGDWLDLLRAGAALLFLSAAVKWMDDALDVEYDICQGKRTLAARFGRATLPYCMVLFGVGMACDLQAAMACFLGSYAAGMFARPTERLQTRVPAWVEICCAIALATALLGWRSALWGVAMMCAVDWLDDVMDRYKDAESGQFNTVVRFGLVEMLLALLGALCIALYANVAWTILAFIVLALLTIVSDMTTARILTTEREEASDVWSHL
ncbi:hypothetical protein GCM10025858_00420 [Alicyclobacillus sacchari]|uniref:hypothetical protein n=1 Tax=Alicyclobacillus sacchari TaxID=392010 RepID=UPI0023E986ED|nr:hypothetical protein [Alicyclobacillus sacchari]GMA55539.1 hypothetical protein GCM10025858_00420 [Alicyclobacillus sacchari]